MVETKTETKKKLNISVKWGKTNGIFIFCRVWRRIPKFKKKKTINCGENSREDIVVACNVCTNLSTHNVRTCASHMHIRHGCQSDGSFSGYQSCCGCVSAMPDVMSENSWRRLKTPCHFICRSVSFGSSAKHRHYLKIYFALLMRRQTHDTIWYVCVVVLLGEFISHDFVYIVCEFVHVSIS